MEGTEALTTVECRCCDWRGESTGVLQVHLKEHGITAWVGDGLTVRLHAAKDAPEWSENTFGFYEADTLVALLFPP